MSLTQVSTGMIADNAVTPGKLSTGAPSWDSSGKVTTTGSVVVADEYYTGAGVGAGASGSWQYKAGSSGFIVGNTNGVEGVRLDASGNWKMNSGYGSVATAYGCRAWVNFNGTGTVAIRASGNVSSITDNGTGDYTVNMATAMPDINYSTVVTPSFQWGNGWPGGVFYTGANGTNQAPTTSTFRFMTPSVAGSLYDSVYINCAVFR